MGENSGDGKIWQKLNEISNRLVKVETLLEERSDNTHEIKARLRNHEERISELESSKHFAIGAKELLGWLIVTAIAVWGCIK